MKEIERIVKEDMPSSPYIGRVNHQIADKVNELVDAVYLIRAWMVHVNDDFYELGRFQHTHDAIQAPVKCPPREGCGCHSGIRGKECFDYHPKETRDEVDMSEVRVCQHLVWKYSKLAQERKLFFGEPYGQAICAGWKQCPVCGVKVEKPS